MTATKGHRVPLQRVRTADLGSSSPARLTPRQHYFRAAISAAIAGLLFGIAGTLVAVKVASPVDPRLDQCRMALDYGEVPHDEDASGLWANLYTEAAKACRAPLATWNL